MDDARLYGRIRAVCCEAWGITPWDFDTAADADRIAAEMVVEALVLRCSLPFVGEAVDAFLHREARAHKKAVVGELQFLALKLKATTSDEDRQAIIRRIEELQSGSAGRTRS